MVIMQRRAACIGIPWDVPLDMPYNINRGHIARICCRALAGSGHDSWQTDIIDKRHDSQKLYFPYDHLIKIRTNVCFYNFIIRMYVRYVKAVFFYILFLLVLLSWRWSPVMCQLWAGTSTADGVWESAVLTAGGTIIMPICARIFPTANPWKWEVSCRQVM